MFASNVDAVTDSANKYVAALDRADGQKWGRDSKLYIHILCDISAMRADGCAAGTIKKDLFAEFARAIEENPTLESEIKAFRAPIGRLFKDKAFENGGLDWAEYVGGFSTQAEWRAAHRKATEATEATDGGEGGADGATDEQRLAAIVAILGGCDDSMAVWEAARPTTTEEA